MREQTPTVHRYLCLILILSITANVLLPLPVSAAPSAKTKVSHVNTSSGRAVALPGAQAQNSADGLWSHEDKQAAIRSMESAGAQSGRKTLPNAYRAAQLNEQRLTQLLARAPMEFTTAANSGNVTITLPMPDGTFARFRIVESPVMAPALVARYPEIKTYAGTGVEDPTASVRFSRTPAGLHALILTTKGSVFIDPLIHGNTSLYISYYKHDYARTTPFVEDNFEKELAAGPSRAQSESSSSRLSIANGASLRTYRIAIAAAGEFTVFHGGTVAQALAEIVKTLNRVNIIYEREVAVRLTLVANNDQLIFTDPASDPYTNNSNGDLTVTQNQQVVDNAIGSANYDIGHIFNMAGANQGPGDVCKPGEKAKGVTGRSDENLVGDPFDVDFVAHEFGHQFGGRHTWNASGAGSCTADQRETQTNYETGSGSTIMSYAGICEPQNLQPNADDYFHVNSLDEIINFMADPATGGSCGTATATGNQPPTMPALTDYNIPARTPFALEAAGATDGNGDALTYTWEQFDPGGANTSDNTVGPLFRSRRGTASPVRFFPSLEFILNNANVPPTTYTQNNKTYITGESLPTVQRTLNFRVTVRDQRASGGGLFRSQSMKVNVFPAGDNSGFAVTAPNTAVTVQAGTQLNVTWSVSNTNAAPINTASVRISLSTDGGQTFPTVLAASTDNDGSASVTIPSNIAATTTARVKVEAAGNIFFDIADANFTIQAATSTLPTVQMNTASINVAENAGSASVVVTRTGDLSGASTVSFATANGTASDRSDYTTVLGTLSFAANEATKTINVFVANDALKENAETFTVTLSSPTGATLGSSNVTTATIVDDDTADGPSPVGNTGFNSEFFVRQHYVDFLNRAPDAPGLAFWVGQTTGCGNADLLVCRINVSAAFFLSPEFQETGFYVIRSQRVAFAKKSVEEGTRIGFQQFIRDSRQVGEGFIDGQTGSAQVLEANKQAYAEQIVSSAEFINNFPTSQTAEQYVAALFAKAGVTPTANDTQQAVNAYNAAGSAVAGRVAAFRKVADSQTVRDAEFRTAFVLMQYFGYLRRDPDPPGYAFWLGKLNDFNGNYINAEMVKAFITSGEYIFRFGL